MYPAGSHAQLPGSFDQTLPPNSSSALVPHNPITFPESCLRIHGVLSGHLDTNHNTDYVKSAGTWTSQDKKGKVVKGPKSTQ